jgi:hypothetical protein
MAASNAEHRLRFIPQTTCIQQLQEMRRNVKPAELLKWNPPVRIVGQLIQYTGVVDVSILSGMHRI